jgi:hypothetical protein
MAKLKGEGFANMAYLTVTEAVAGTLKFAKLQVASEFVGPSRAMVIHRMELVFTGLNNLNTSADWIDVALTLSDRVTDISDLSQAEVIVWGQKLRLDIGTAASGLIIENPQLREFENMPGGGLLVPVDFLYLGVKSTGAAGVCGASARIYYSALELDTASYLELLQARRVLTT